MFDAEKFIKQFEEGKFGNNIKHPYHIQLLYNAARNNYPMKMFLTDKTKEIPAILMFYAENYLREESEFAWIDKKGFPIFVAFGGHQFVAECFFGRTEREFELEHAKISEKTKTVDDAVQYLNNAERPTPAMTKTIEKILYKELSKQPFKLMQN